MAYLLIIVALTKLSEYADAAELKLTTPAQSWGPNVSTTVMAASLANSILVGLTVVYILPEVSIITTRFFPPVVDATNQGLFLGS